MFIRRLLKDVICTSLIKAVGFSLVYIDGIKVIFIFIFMTSNVRYACVPCAIIGTCGSLRKILKNRNSRFFLSNK